MYPFFSLNHAYFNRLTFSSILIYLPLFAISIEMNDFVLNHFNKTEEKKGTCTAYIEEANSAYINIAKIN